MSYGDECLDEVDRIDDDIIALIKERQDAVERLDAWKVLNALPRHDRARDKEVVHTYQDHFGVATGEVIALGIIQAERIDA